MLIINWKAVGILERVCGKSGVVISLATLESGFHPRVRALTTESIQKSDELNISTCACSCYLEVDSMQG